MPFGTSEFSATPEGLKYCSESCFTQSRRASYKRAKTCDWCKHIRHAVSYVDFQDGASQLQFCSDKCLNQYKMQIFCKETQAHLDLNPHLKDKGNISHDNLITPDLWMRNCRSRSMTPDQRSNDSRATESPIANTAAANQQFPTLKIAPVSKLLSCDQPDSMKSTSQRQQREETTSMSELKNYSQFGQKSRMLRKRRINRLSSSSSSVNASGNISEGSNNNDSSNENRNTRTKMHTVNMISEKNRLNNLLQPTLLPSLQSKISPTPGNNVPIDEPNAAFMQRYNLMSPHTPNIFRMNENRSLQNALRQSGQFIAPLIPKHAFSDGPPPELMPKLPQMAPFPKLSPMSRQRPEPTSSMSSARKHIFESENHRLFLLQQQQQQQQHKSFALNEFVNNLFGTITPPSTILIPYPIVLPLPLPIPIPLPYEAFLRAAASNPRNQNSNGRSSSSTNEDDIGSIPFSDRKDHRAKSNEPLDFTKEKITSRIAKSSDGESDDEDYRASNSDHETDIHASMHHKNEAVKAEPLKLKTLHRQPSNKRSLTKDSTCENNRPLRKRKRIIDCDYLRLRDCNESINPRKSI